MHPKNQLNNMENPLNILKQRVQEELELLECPILTGEFHDGEKNAYYHVLNVIDTLLKEQQS